MGVEALGLATSGAAVSWMTFPEEVVVGEGVGSPAAVRVTTVDGVLKLGFEEPEVDAGGVVLEFAAEVSAGRLVEDKDDDDEVEVADGWPLDRNCERIPEASLGETVVVVVALAELAVTVTVTVTALTAPLVVDVEDEVKPEVEEVPDDEVVPTSEPLTPPLTPAAFIRPTTVLSLVQSRDVPAARILGMAKHC